MPTNYRCKYNNIWDSTTRRYRNCKNKKCHGNFCMIHYKLMYTEYAIMIQKMYKGYYIRKKLKIYYNLPRDLQRKIIWHVNSDLYLRNYNSRVSKIIYRRYKEFNYKYMSIEYDNDYNEFYTNLISLVKLSIKYHAIMNIRKIPFYNGIMRVCRDVATFLSLTNPTHIDLDTIITYIRLFTLN